MSPLSHILRRKDERVNALLDECDGNVIDIGDQRAMSFIKKLLIFLAGVAVVIIIWYLVSELYNVFMSRSMSFPGPVVVFERTYTFFATDFTIFGNDMLAHTKASLFRWIKGFLVAFIIGMLLGIILGSNERFYQLGIVPVNILQLIPGLAWFPVTILLFGIGEESAVFIIAITVISPIAINVSNGLRRVPKVNLRVATMSGRTRMETFTEVLMPFAALDILTGIRIGMANGWRMLIAAEMVVGVALGLGFAIQITTGYTDYVSAFACIVIIAVIGILIDKVILETVEGYARRRLGLGDGR